MKKVLIISDIHGRTVWKQLIETDNYYKIVFLGDYFDSYDIPGINQIHNFKDIIEFKNTTDIEVILLIGNHDFQYFPSTFNNNCSGHQYNLEVSIRKELEDAKNHLQMCHIHNKFLFSHAGISIVWLKNLGYNDEPLEEYINEMWKYKPLAFSFCGNDPYGGDIYQTPLWIRPNSLLVANKKSELEKKYKQVVGHTHKSNIENVANKYFFTDTLNSNKFEYLVIENNKPIIKKIN